MNLKWQDGRFDVSRLIDTSDGRIIAKVSRDTAPGDTDWQQWNATVYPAGNVFAAPSGEPKCVPLGQFESREKAKAAVDAGLAKLS